MSILDDLCKDPDFRTKVEEAVKSFFEDNHQEEFAGPNGGTFDGTVQQATVTSVDEVKADTVNGLTATVMVSGEVSLDVQYLDEEGDDQNSTIEGTFEGCLTVEFPSDILASDDRDSVLADVEVEEAELNFSASTKESNE